MRTYTDNKNLFNYKKLVLYIALVLPYIKPLSFQKSGFVETIYYVLKAITIVIILYMYLKNKKISKFMILNIIYQAILIIATAINNGPLIKSIGISMGFIAICMISEIMINDNYNYFFKSFITILDIYVILNIISLFIIQMFYSNEIVFFLGIDNRFIFYYLPLVALRFIYSIKKDGKISKIDILIYIACLLTLIQRWAVGSMLGMIIFIPIILIYKKIAKFDKIFNLYTYSIGNFIVNYLVIFKQIQYKFSDFLINVLHKDPTFTSRTIIWEKAINSFKESFILGNGRENDLITMSKLHGANHAHNHLVTLLYRGGVALFTIYTIILFIVAKELKKCKNRNASAILCFTFLIIFVFSLVDTYDYPLYFVLLCLGYNINKIF